MNPFFERKLSLHQEIASPCGTKKFSSGFTAKYNCDKLVYYKGFSRIEEAIAEEKRIKGGSRQKKIDLINRMNSGWKDLYRNIDL